MDNTPMQSCEVGHIYIFLLSDLGETGLAPIPIDFNRGKQNTDNDSIVIKKEDSESDAIPASPSVLFGDDDAGSVFDPTSPSVRPQDVSRLVAQSDSLLEDCSSIIANGLDIEACTISAGRDHRRCQRCYKVLRPNRLVDHFKVHRVNQSGAKVQHGRRCRACAKAKRDCIVAKYPGDKNINTFRCVHCIGAKGRCSLASLGISAAFHVGLHPALRHVE
ncbi:Chromatin modification-related protein [Purpureocillium lavendulum]|uniref:Chromatin modification-related protein n=1 Tax=Purpureocillium lavendulum TaxID=1247861 RepID=A0AB34FKT5_9HYPO|nr:Chromatin modification-related protein [Purpureocillium lavendulum]